MATPACAVPLAMFFFVKQGLLVVGGRNSFTKRDLPTAEFYLPSNKNWTKMGTPGYRCFCAVTFRLSVSMGNHVSTNNLTEWSRLPFYLYQNCFCHQDFSWGPIMSCILFTFTNIHGVGVTLSGYFGGVTKFKMIFFESRVKFLSKMNCQKNKD